MDFGAGHFSRLEFSTDSDFAFPFAKDIAALARHAVQRARSDPFRHLSRPSAAAPEPSRPLGLANVTDLTPMESGGAFGEVCIVFFLSLTMSDGSQNCASNVFDLELDNWSTFLPVTDFDDSIPEFFIS